MKHTLTIAAMICCFALGTLLAQVPHPFKPLSERVSATPQSTPCKIPYAPFLELCTNVGTTQLFWSFPRTSWDNTPLPTGSAIGMQMVYTTAYANGTKIIPPYTFVQLIYSGHGGSHFGQQYPIDPAYWTQLTASLDAQKPVSSEPAPVASSVRSVPPVSGPLFEQPAKKPKRPKEVPRGAIYLGLSGDADHWKWTDKQGINHIHAEPHR